MQHLLFESHQWDPFTIIKPSGELDLHTQQEFERTVSGQLSGGSVVLDLSDLEFVAISALRSLMVCHAEAESAGRQLLLAAVPRQTLRLLSLSGLDGVLPVHASVAEAVCTSSLVQPSDPFGGDLTRLDVG